MYHSSTALAEIFTALRVGDLFERLQLRVLHVKRNERVQKAHANKHKAIIKQKWSETNIKAKVSKQ